MKRWGACVVAVLALVAGGCGSDDSDNADLEDTTAVTTPEPAPPEGPPELGFYDWEPNLIGANGRPGSGEPTPKGRIPSLYRAATLASTAKPLDEPTDQPSDRGNDSGGAKYYVFGPDQELIEGPLGEEPTDVEPGSEVVKVPRGIILVQDEKPENAGPATPDFYYVLEDDRELSIDDIVNPEQNFDPNTQEPIVVFDFTADGRKRFANLTRRVVKRGASLPATGGPPELSFQQFAIVLNGQLVTLALIDFIEHPDGIDGSTGAQINGVGSLQETQELAELLKR